MTQPVWARSASPRGLLGPLPLADYPTRTAALSIIAALASGDVSSGRELDEATGIVDALKCAHTCYAVFGYPELKPERIAATLADAFMRPSAPQEHVEETTQGTAGVQLSLPLMSPLPKTEAALPPVYPSYGFTPRQV